MSKLTLGTHPFLLGFNQFERLVERTAKTDNEGYPPYNINNPPRTLTVSPWLWPVLEIMNCQSPLKTASWLFLGVNQMKQWIECICTEISQLGNSSGHFYWLTESRWARL